MSWMQALLFTFLPSFILSLLYNVLLALPAWAWWTVAGLGVRYFTFLPEAWQSVPLGHMVGLFQLFWAFRSACIGSLHVQMGGRS